MNQNKFNGDKSANANFAKKATLATITAMAALTLAACGNNDAGAKPAGSSEPKTEQSAKNNSMNNDSNSNNSSETDASGENDTLNQFINNVKSAGFEVVSGTENTDGGAYGVDVKLEGFQGHIGVYGSTYQIDFSSSLGDSAKGTANGNSGLNQAVNSLKKIIANK